MSLRLAAAVALCLGLLAPVADAAVDRGGAADPSTTGLSSGGDPYFPLDGNRGYDVERYRISNTYDPQTDRLARVGLSGPVGFLVRWTTMSP